MLAGGAECWGLNCQQSVKNSRYPPFRIFPALSFLTLPRHEFLDGRAPIPSSLSPRLAIVSYKKALTRSDCPKPDAELGYRFVTDRPRFNITDASINLDLNPSLLSLSYAERFSRDTNLSVPPRASHQ